MGILDRQESGSQIVLRILLGSEEKKIIIFDGVCNFCNWAVKFVVKRDTAGVFRFTASQSKSGQNLLSRFDVAESGDKSIVLVDGDQCFARSDAVLEIFRYLGSGWQFMRFLKIFPKKLRDWGYSVFSRYRYTVFGKRDSCMVPSEKIKERFIE